MTVARASNNRDIEARYLTNNGRLPQNLIEDMRNAFAASTESLETTPRQEGDKKEILLEMWRQQAKMQLARELASVINIGLLKIRIS